MGKYIFLFCVLCCFMPFSYGQNVDSLKLLLKTKMHDTTRLNVLGELTQYADVFEWKRFNQELHNLALKRRQTVPAKSKLYRVYSRHYATSLHNMGIIANEKSNKIAAAKYFRKSIEVCQEIKDEKNMVYPYSEVANLLVSEGKYKDAIDILFRNLRIYEKYKDKLGIAGTYSSIGDIYFWNKKYEKALSYFRKSMTEYTRAKINEGMCNLEHKIGISYVGLEQYEQAERHIRSGIDIMGENVYFGTSTSLYQSLGSIFRNKKKYAEAIQAFEQAMVFARLTGDLNNVINVNNILANTYMLQQRYDLAEKYALECLEISKMYKLGKKMQDASYTLHEIYKKKKNPAKALEMLEIYDSIISEDYSRQVEDKINEKQLKFDFEKKELINKARNEKNIARIKLESAKRTTWIIVLLSVLLLLSLSFWNTWKRNRQNTLIEQQKNNMLKQKLLVSQMNPHFIFNSLNAIQNCIFRSDPMSAGNYLSRFADLMRMILDYSFENRISLRDEIHFLESYMDLQRFRFEYKFDFEIHVDPSLDTSGIGVPPMLAQPFVENAIEHGLAPLKKPGLLTLSIRKDGQSLLFEIRDNGVGLNYQKNKSQKHESRALNITRERLQNLLPDTENLILSVEDLGPGPEHSGVCVRFKLPIQELEI